MKIVESLSKLIDLSFSENNELIKVELGKMAKKYALLAKEETGISLDDFEHTVDTYALRHTIKKHGSPKAEAARGQIAVTIDDFKLIPQIIKFPDSVEYSRKNKLGNPVLIYTKVIENQIFYLEEIRANRKEVAMQTMYKRKSPTKK